MKIESKEAIEILGVIAVVLSLIFVGLELQQSTIASRSAAYQELGIATAEYWYLLANNRELNDLVTSIDSGTLDDYRNLNESDRRLVVSLTIGSLRAFETVYLQVDQGLLDPSAMESLGYDAFTRSGILNILWCDVKPFVGTSFINYLESNGLPTCG